MVAFVIAQKQRVLLMLSLSAVIIFLWAVQGWNAMGLASRAESAEGLAASYNPTAVKLKYKLTRSIYLQDLITRFKKQITFLDTGIKRNIHVSRTP